MKLEKIDVNIEQILPESLKQIGKEKYINEIRLHPLLKWFWAVIAPIREKYQPFKVSDDILKDLLIPRVHDFLNAEEKTPKDPLYGRIKRNEAVVFPNLWSWAKIAICRITKKESILLKDITKEQLYDAFLASQEYFKINYENQKEMKVYPSINMNFLRPSASSVVHPHFQLLITPIPVPLLGMYLDYSNQYFEHNHSTFFEDYIALEKRNQVHWLGEIGKGADKFTFLTPWCPMAGRDEIFFIGPKSSFPLSNECWKNLADGFHRIFIGYNEIGPFSVNFNIISDIYNSNSNYFRIFGMIWSRSLKNLDISDRGFAEIGLKITLTYSLPELIAKRLRKYW